MTRSSVRYETQDELAHDPVRGLPELLPRGEELLWQGSPSWKGLAISAYHVRAVAFYFALLLAWRLASGVISGETLAGIAASLAVFAVLAMAAVGTLVGLAVLASRTTVYTITSRRVVMRIGIALPMTLNLPFKAVSAASMRSYPDGTVDLPMHLAPEHRLAFLILWPHCRPWEVRKPQPMLRRVPDGAHVSRILADALQAFAQTNAAVSAPSPAAGAQAKATSRHVPARNTVAA